MILSLAHEVVANSYIPSALLAMFFSRWTNFLLSTTPSYWRKRWLRRRTSPSLRRQGLTSRDSDLGCVTYQRLFNLLNSDDLFLITFYTWSYLLNIFLAGPFACSCLWGNWPQRHHYQRYLHVYRAEAQRQDRVLEARRCLKVPVLRHQQDMDGHNYGRCESGRARRLRLHRERPSPPDAGQEMGSS